MLSMTGFGHAERTLEECDIFVDVRSVNSRYLDFKARLGRELTALEGEIKSVVQEHVGRGRIEVSVDLRLRAIDQLELNLAALQNYLNLEKQIQGIGVGGGLSIAELLAAPGVVNARSDVQISESISRAVCEVVEEAVGSLLEARRREGLSLQVELRERLGLLREYVEQIGTHAQEVQDAYRQKIEARVKEALKEVVLDESRLAQEIVYYVDRSDISEELTRLRSHIAQFENYLSEERGNPVGKKLDFLCQELNREVNTTLSKSGSAKISEIGIEVKAQVEAIREQVQNVE